MRRLNFIVYILIIVFCTCETPHQPIRYDPLNMYGKRQGMVKEDEKSYKELITKGFSSYVDIFKFGDKKYYGKKIYEMDIYLQTLEKYHSLKIHSFEFEFEGKKKNIKINKNIILDREKERFVEELIFSVEGNDKLNLETYYYYLPFFINEVKLDLHSIFNATDEDIGRYIDLTLRMYYSLDKGELLVQENKHLVHVFFKRKPS